MNRSKNMFQSIDFLLEALERLSVITHKCNRAICADYLRRYVEKYGVKK